jgi:hypothetical protein
MTQLQGKEAGAQAAGSAIQLTGCLDLGQANKRWTIENQVQWHCKLSIRTLFYAALY